MTYSTISSGTPKINKPQDVSKAKQTQNNRNLKQLTFPDFLGEDSSQNKTERFDSRGVIKSDTHIIEESNAARKESWAAPTNKADSPKVTHAPSNQVLSSIQILTSDNQSLTPQRSTQTLRSHIAKVLSHTSPINSMLSYTNSSTSHHTGPKNTKNPGPPNAVPLTTASHVVLLKSSLKAHLAQLGVDVVMLDTEKNHLRVIINMPNIDDKKHSQILTQTQNFLQSKGYFSVEVTINQSADFSFYMIKKD